MFFATPLLKNMYFRKHPRILICSGNPFRRKPQNAKGTPTETTSSFVASRQGPGAEHLPLATSINRYIPESAQQKLDLFKHVNIYNYKSRGKQM